MKQMLTYFKKDHLFKFNYWLVPVHLGAHWAMMVNFSFEINFTNEMSVCMHCACVRICVCVLNFNCLLGC